jgi:chitin deacetylase
MGLSTWLFASTLVTDRQEILPRGMFSQDVTPLGGVDPAVAGGVPITSPDRLLQDGITQFGEAWQHWDQERQASLLFYPPDQFAGQVVRHVPLANDNKAVALTFDDGPWPNSSAQILDILKQHDVKGTFFIVGRALQSFPAVAQRMVAEGHAIGNHTWNHRTARANPQAAAHEIDNMAVLMERTLGIKTRLYRPPGGVLNNGLDQYAQNKGYTTVMWSMDTLDWRRPQSQTIVQRVLNGVHPGDIVLFHDGGGDRRSTVAALPRIITELQKRGYRLVTVPELLELKVQEQQQLAAQKAQSQPAQSQPAQP